MEKDANMFEMIVEDIFSITGRGTVFLGKIRSGSVSVGDSVVCKTPMTEVHTRVIGIDNQRGKILQTAEEGSTVGIVCKKIDHKSLVGAWQGEGEDARVVGVTLTLGAKKSWWQF